MLFHMIVTGDGQAWKATDCRLVSLSDDGSDDSIDREGMAEALAEAPRLDRVLNTLFRMTASAPFFGSR